MPEVSFRVVVPIPSIQISTVQVSAHIGSRLLIRVYSSATIRSVEINYQHRNFHYGTAGADQDLVVSISLDEAVLDSIPSPPNPETLAEALARDTAVPPRW